MEIFIGWVIFAILAGLLASSRGRSGFGYFLLALVLSPLIVAILLLILANLKDKAVVYAGGEAATPETHVRCPDCRELVRRDAIKCKHCGTTLIPS